MITSFNSNVRILFFIYIQPFDIIISPEQYPITIARIPTLLYSILTSLFIQFVCWKEFYLRLFVEVKVL